MEAIRGHQIPWRQKYRQLWALCYTWLEQNLDPCEDQKIFLTTELSVQPHYFDFLIYVLPVLIWNSKSRDEEGWHLCYEFNRSIFLCLIQYPAKCIFFFFSQSWLKYDLGNVCPTKQSESKSMLEKSKNISSRLHTENKVSEILANLCVHCRHKSMWV